MSEEIKQEMAMADTLIKSGFLPMSIKTPEQAVAIIKIGRELGIPMMQALRQINVIQSRPTMSAELMLSLAYQHIPGFRYAIVETTSTRCVCKFERPNHIALTHKFDLDDAKSLGLITKENWRKQPATMLRWRCISSGLRLVVPDALGGIYTPEEILPDAQVSAESGMIMDAAPTTEPSLDTKNRAEKLAEKIGAKKEEEKPPASAKKEEEKPPASAKTTKELPAFEQKKGCISAKQAGRLFAIARQQNVERETLKRYLLDNYKVDHTNQIRWQDYDAICEWADNGGQLTNEKQMPNEEDRGVPYDEKDELSF